MADETKAMGNGLERPHGVPAIIERAAWGLGAIGLLLIAVFDLGAPLAFNDDWSFAWDVRHFNPLHIHLYPNGSAVPLVQIVWSWAMTFGHQDQRLLRLSLIPFVILAAGVMYRLARQLGAAPVWSALAVLGMLAYPVFSADATSFMSDIPYVALVLFTTLAAMRWHHDRRWAMLCVAGGILATLQRQTGVMLPVSLTAVFFLARKDFRVGMTDWSLLGILWLGCLAAIAIPSLTGIAPVGQGQRITDALSPQPSYALNALFYLLGLLGMALAPFLPGLALLMRAKSGRITDLLTTAIIIGLLAVALFVGIIFPGNVFTIYGFNYGSLLGKEQLFSFSVFFFMEAVSILALGFFVRNWRLWWPGSASAPQVVLLVVAVGQLMPLLLLHYTPYDRYYIPVVLTLGPLAALALGRAAAWAPRSLTILSALMGLLLALGGLVVYAIGEQDYQAWAVARNRAACLAYQYVSPSEVDAGYEANAVYLEIPYYEHTGTIVGGIPQPGSPMPGPANPAISLVSTDAGDQRPGYSYFSLAPGKVVLVPGVRGQKLAIQVPNGLVPACP